MDSRNFQLVAGATASLAIAVPLLYYLLLPKPLPGIPHNPVTGLLGDLPELAQTLKDNERSVVDYFNNHINKHGPISQVRICSQQILKLRRVSYLIFCLLLRYVLGVESLSSSPTEVKSTA